MKMIRIFWCFLLVFYSVNLPAQDISYRKNTIYKDGKPYAYLVKSGSAWARHYSFRNLHDQELITIKPVAKTIGGGYDFIYYEVTFKGLNQQTELQDDDDLARRLAYEFAQFDVLQNEKLNPEAIQKFLEKYPARRFSSQHYIAR